MVKQNDCPSVCSIGLTAHFESDVMASLGVLTTQMQHLREGVGELKIAGERRDEAFRLLDKNVQHRDHARQSDVAAVYLKLDPLIVSVAAVQLRLQTLEEKSEAKMLHLEKTAGHRIGTLERKSSIMSGAYLAAVTIGGAVVFIFQLLWHIFDAGRILLRK